MQHLEVRSESLSADALARALERVECASVIVCHPDLATTAAKACFDAGADLLVAPSFERCAPGEWELF